MAGSIANPVVDASSPDRPFHSGLLGEPEGNDYADSVRPVFRRLVQICPCGLSQLGGVTPGEHAGRGAIPCDPEENRILVSMKPQTV